jgi:hypothetical protein
MLTGAAPHCKPQPGGTSPVLGWSVIAVKPVKTGETAELGLDRTSDEKTSKCTSKRLFFMSDQEFKKIWKTVLQE